MTHIIKNGLYLNKNSDVLQNNDSNEYIFGQSSSHIHLSPKVTHLSNKTTLNEETLLNNKKGHVSASFCMLLCVAMFECVYV